MLQGLSPQSCPCPVRVSASLSLSCLYYYAESDFFILFSWTELWVSACEVWTSMTAVMLMSSSILFICIQWDGECCLCAHVYVRSIPHQMPRLEVEYIKDFSLIFLFSNQTGWFINETIWFLRSKNDDWSCLETPRFLRCFLRHSFYLKLILWYASSNPYHHRPQGFPACWL